MIEVRAARVGGKTNVFQLAVGMGIEILGVTADQVVQRGRCLGRYRQDLQRPGVLGFFGLLLGSFLDHHVGVGPAEAEGTHAGNSRLLATRPTDRLPGHLQRKLVPGDVRIGLLEMQMAGDLFVLKGKHHLDQPGDTGRRLQMADVRLGRADHQRVVLGSIWAEHVS